MPSQPSQNDFIKMMISEVIESRKSQEENATDLFSEARDNTNTIQRQIVLGLQSRLSKLVENDGSIQEIHELSMCICANLEIKAHIDHIF